MLKAAICVTDITPKCAAHLRGYAGEARRHTAEGIYDHSFVVSSLLEVDGVRLSLTSIGIIMLGGEKAAVTKGRIQKILITENDHIIISATHIHSGASGLDDMAAFGTPDNPEYSAYICEQITDSIQHLEQQLCEVQVYVTTGKIHGCYNKRVNKYLSFGDHAVTITFIRGDTVIASMCNFNCHATVLGAGNMLVSPDFVGKVRSLMEKDLDVTPYTLTGVSGDISNR